MFVSLFSVASTVQNVVTYPNNRAALPWVEEMCLAGAGGDKVTHAANTHRNTRHVQSQHIDSSNQSYSTLSDKGSVLLLVVANGPAAGIEMSASKPTSSHGSSICR